MKNSIFIMSSKEPREKKLVHYCYHWIQKRKLGGTHQKPKSASTKQANLYTKPSHNKLNVSQSLFTLQEVIKIFIHVLFVVDTCLHSLCISSVSRGCLIT